MNTTELDNDQVIRDVKIELDGNRKLQRNIASQKVTKLDGRQLTQK